MTNKLHLPDFSDFKTYLVAHYWEMEANDLKPDIYHFRHPEHPENIRFTLSANKKDDNYNDYINKALRILSAIEKRPPEIMLLDLRTKLEGRMVVRIPGDSSMKLASYDDLYELSKEFACFSFSHTRNPREIVKRAGAVDRALNAFEIIPPERGSFVFEIKASRSSLPTSKKHTDDSTHAFNSIARTFSTLKAINSDKDINVEEYITNNFKERSLDAGSLHIISQLDSTLENIHEKQLEFYFQVHRGGNLLKLSETNKFNAPLMFTEPLRDKVSSAWAHFVSMEPEVNLGPYEGQIYEIKNDRVRFRSYSPVQNTTEMLDIMNHDISKQQLKIIHDAKEAGQTVWLNCKFVKTKRVALVTQFKGFSYEKPINLN